MTTSQESALRDTQDSLPKTIFNRCARSIENLLRRFSYISAIGMLLMILPTVADVAGRLIFNAPVRGAFELTGLLMAVVIYMGVAHAQTERAHVRVSFLTGTRSLQFQRVVDLLVYLFSIGMIGIVLYATFAQALHAVRIGEYMYGSTRFPIWPARILVAIGFFFLLVQFIIDFFRAFLQLAKGKPRRQEEPSERS